MNIEHPQENPPTLADIQSVIDAYLNEPTDAALTNVFQTLAQTPPGSVLIRGIHALAKEKNRHGMTPTEIKACVKAEREALSVGDNPYFENGIFKPIRVVDALCEYGDYLTLPYDNKLRIYDNGCYHMDGNDTTEKTIHQLLGDAVKSAYVTDVVTLLKQQTKTDIDRNTAWINLKNGRLCLHSWQLLDHTPAHKDILQIPVEYKPDVTCPTIDSWLNDVLPDGNDQFLLLQAFGYSLLQEAKFGKIIVLEGPTHTGKSTCLHLLKALVGLMNTASLSLHAFDNEALRFARSSIVSALVNTSTDLSNKIMEGDGPLKAASSGDPIQIEFKGQDSFTYTPFTTFWASCNELPRSKDRSSGWRERLIIIPFKQQHTGASADRDILKNMELELPGLLNKVIEALQVLISNNAFLETENTRTAAAQYLLENDHVAEFLEETYVRDADSHLAEDDIWQSYKAWTEEQEIKSLSKVRFRKSLTQNGCKRFSEGGRGIQRTYYWKGLA